MIWHPKIPVLGSFNILIFCFCLKEHFKAQGMTLPVFLIRSLFGQYTASYMILLPFFDTFLSHWTCDSFFALKNGLFQKRGHVMPCALRCSFKQNKKINILNEPGNEILGCAFWKVQTEKKRKSEKDFFKKFFSVFYHF